MCPYYGGPAVSAPILSCEGGDQEETGELSKAALMTRILVVDDHEVVREGLKQIISRSRDMVVADEAGNGAEALEKVQRKNYDVVVLDISMPDRSGLDVLKEIKSQKPELAVLMLTVHPEGQYAVRTLRAGASGYLTKKSVSKELVEAIRKVSSGGRYITASLAERLAFGLGSDSEKPLHETLSDREYEVMCKLASGKTVKEIAEELSLSPLTVSTHRSRIMEKMGMKNNVELALYAIRNELID